MLGADALKKHVVGGLLTITWCIYVALLVILPDSTASGAASGVAAGGRHRNYTGTRDALFRRQPPTMILTTPRPQSISRDQQRPAMTSSSRRECLPVSFDALWIRFNFAEPPQLLVPTAATVDFRSPLSKFANDMKQGNDVDRVRREIVHRGGKRRTRTKPTVRAAMSSSVPTTTTTTMATKNFVRRKPTTVDSRRNRPATVATSKVTAAPSKSSTSKSLLRNEKTLMRSRSPAFTSPLPTMTSLTMSPEVDGLNAANAATTNGEADDEGADSVFRQTSWQCMAEPYWRRLPPGTFPPYIQTARCRQSNCMLGLYECVARRYGVKVLRRLDGQCLPVPLVSASGNTTYEQAWTLVETQVVVGCECAKRRNTGAYYGLSKYQAP